MTFQSPAQRAAKILQEYWDKILPVDPVRIAGKLGVRVYQSAELAGAGLSGVCELSEEGTARIFVNPDEPETRQRFTVAHELGHIVLGHVQRGAQLRDALGRYDTLQLPIETAANRFAAELLMPEEAVEVIFRSHIFASPTELAQKFGVSVAAMSYRLQDFNRNQFA
jgi:Zn-dependent peptidase ImmA (M78 family)